MKQSLSVVLVFLMIAVLLSPAAAQEPPGSPPAPPPKMEEIPVVIDVVFLRPAGLVACVAGLAATVVALPFAIPSGSMDQVYQALIADPFYFTFKRPIGQGIRPAGPD
jgi:hypothetical protein